MNVFDHPVSWKYAAVGKHPSAKDFIKLSDLPTFADGLSDIMETAYNTLAGTSGKAPEFSSWRFWTKGSGKDAFICGVIRESSDSVGRPYPFLIVGSGTLKDWEQHWELLPFACENIWCQFEYLATHTFDNVKKMEAELIKTRPPEASWREHAATRLQLNAIGSPRDPYASFLDFTQLSKQAAELSGKKELFVSLDRGPYNDKILQVSLWHHLFKASVKTPPSTLFLGGTLEKAYLAAFNRALKAPDLVQLWSVSAAGLWKNAIGTEYAMDISILGKESISPDRPAGTDVRYDPAFQELQDEVDKLSSPSAAGSVNWEKVVRFASDILAHKSKDLLVAAYLAVALIHTRRHDGLSMGVKLMLDLMGKFWEELYPPKERIRGRVRSLEWWIEKSDNAIRQLPAEALPAQQASILTENLARIDKLLNQHLDGPPSLRPLSEFAGSLDIKPEEKPKEEAAVPSPPPAVEAVPKTTAKPASDVSPAEDMSSAQAAQRLLDSHLQKVREIGGYFRQQDPANPLPYRLNRRTIWCNIDSLPPATSNRTRIPAPDAQVIKMLFDLRNSGDAEALLKASEGRLAQFIFWLDLNRFTAEALTRLGNRFDKAYRAVCQETAFLISNFPGLSELAFADGTPFANPETKNWIRSIAWDNPVEPSPDPAPELGASPGEDAVTIARVIADAQGLIRKGKLLEAMEALQAQLNNTASRREKILWRLAIAQLLINVKQSRLALPHLEQIIREIDAFALEDYDPALALKGLKLAWSGFESQSDDQFKHKAADVLYRIARLDMAEVVRLSKS